MRRFLSVCLCTCALHGCVSEGTDGWESGSDSFDDTDSGVPAAVKHKVCDGFSVDRGEGGGEVASPLSLTASDGTGLKMRSLEIRSVLDNPLAFTEMRVVFQNPLNRTMEGRFEVTLPPSAAISRLAMKIDGKWQEAEVVERQEAREVYEDFLHRSQDPLLMEKKAGNQFRARVFPIPPRGKKEIVLSYSEELPSTREPYRLLLDGLPELDVLSVDINLMGTSEEVFVHSDGVSLEDGHLVLRQEMEAPEGDLEIWLPDDTTPLGLRYKNLVLARLTPSLDTTRDHISNLTILFDTSASRALGFEHQVEWLGELVETLADDGLDFDLRVVCFDQEIDSVFEGRASQFDIEARLEILRRGALGASNLEAAVRHILEEPAGYDRLLVFTDGVTTSGKMKSGELGESANGLKESGFRRIDAIVAGGIRDQTSLEALTEAGLPMDGVVLDAQLPLEDAVRGLTSKTYSSIRVSVSGARSWWPRVIDGVQPGDRVLVYADLPDGAPMRVQFEGEETDVHDVETKSTNRLLLERAWVRAEIDRLTRSADRTKNTSEKARIEKRIISLSTKHRVLSDLTALLVLETEADYRRFGIDRRSLADVLTVGKDGIEILRRTDAVFTEGGGNSDSAKMGEGFGFGGLGLTGTGRGGGGHGEGSIGYGRLATIGTLPAARSLEKRAIAPRMMATQPMMIGGSLPRGVVKRVVGRRTNELRGCYNEYLRIDPELEGRVEVQFIIDGTGKVVGAAVTDSTLGHNPVEECILEVVLGWEFPTVASGGIVAVTYPFVFAPDNGETRDEILGRQLVRGAQKNALGASHPTHRPIRRDIPDGFAEAGIPSETSVATASEDWRLTDASSDVDDEGFGEDNEEEQRQWMLHNESAYTGRLLEIMRLIHGGREEEALAHAWAWRYDAPGDVMALVGLGEALEAVGDLPLAARAYGSLIDLFPSRADMRRMAGERLERVGRHGLELALDTYRVALGQRPDHSIGYRLYAYALLKAGRPAKAFKTLLDGEEQVGLADDDWSSIVEEDLSLVAAAWLRRHPGNAKKIRETLEEAGVTPDEEPSVRLVLNWESDANDVDLHVYDENGYGEHAFYGEMTLYSGGELYNDVTTGYGPECFRIDGDADGYPYRMQAHYYSRGPMGYGMGKLQVIRHDGRGALSFSERPFVIMRDNAYVNLGVVRKPRTFK